MKSFFSKIYWQATAIIGSFFLPIVALGAGGGVTCGGSGQPECLFTNPLQANDLSSLVESLAQYAVQIGATIAVVMIIYSGFSFVKAQGVPAEIEKAKKTFTYTVIGTAVLLGAWVIATAIKELIAGLQ